MSLKSTVRCIVINPGEEPKERVVLNRLKTFQGLVNGYIVVISRQDNLVMIGDEEARLRQRVEPNFYINGELILGPVVCCATDPYGNFVDMTDMEVSAFMESFKKVVRA